MEQNKSYTFSKSNTPSISPTMQYSASNPVTLLPVIYVPQSFIENCRLPKNTERRSKRTKPLSSYEKQIYDELMHKMYGFTVKKPSNANITSTEEKGPAAEPDINSSHDAQIILEASSMPHFDYSDGSETDDMDCKNPVKAKTTVGHSTCNLRVAPIIKNATTQSSYPISTGAQTSPTLIKDEALLSRQYPMFEEINESKYTQTDSLRYSSTRSTQTGVLFDKTVEKKMPVGERSSLSAKKKEKPAENVEEIIPNKSSIKKKDNNRSIREEILSVILQKGPCKKKKKIDDDYLTNLANNNPTVSTRPLFPRPLSPRPLSPRPVLRPRSPCK